MFKAQLPLARYAAMGYFAFLENEAWKGK